jgi:hypothetical protein
LLLASSGTDRVVHAWYVERHDGCAILFDAHDEALQVEAGDFAMPPNPRHAKVNALTHRGRASPVGQSARAREISRCRHLLSSGMRAAHIALVSGSVERTLAVSVLEEDIGAPSDLGAFDAIRVANVLNLSYYYAPEIRRMLKVIAARLAPLGLLLVARIEQRTNHAKLFRLEAGRLRPLASLNRGSEVACLALDALAE